MTLQATQRRQVWDLRVKRSVQTLPEKYQVCAVAFSDAGDQVCLRHRQLLDRNATFMHDKLVAC